MCEYCKQGADYTGRAMYFVKGKEKILCSIMNFDGNIYKHKRKNDYVLSLKKDEGTCLSYDWYDLRINYCPICGKQLRTKKEIQREIDSIEKAKKEDKIVKNNPQISEILENYKELYKVLYGNNIINFLKKIYKNMI